jgi:hypothetical protein
MTKPKCQIKSKCLNVKVFVIGPLDFNIHLNFDGLEKSLNKDGKEKTPDARRAKPEE